MRAAWKGYITLGQLGIPVRLYSAVSSARPSFNLLHEADGSPVDRVLKCRTEGKEISMSETVRAIEHQPGKYVTFTARELERAGVEQLRTIDVKQFSNPEDINPIYYEKPFYIVPSKGGERAYALLREALQRTSKVAIVQFVIYNHEHIASISRFGDLLILNQLRFPSEIVPRSQIKTPQLSRPAPTELEALTSLIDRYSGPFYAEDYHDEQAERINELLEHKVKGLPMPRREIKYPHATPEDELLPALKLSLESGRKT